jgi:superfamily I DNA/RNA helicase
MEQLTDTSVDDNEQTRERRSWLRFIKDERKKIALLELLGADFDSCWACASTFLRAFGRARLVSLASDYESFARLKEVVAETKQRLRELLTLEIDVAEALRKLTDERAVRIMSIHKSKGLEFDTVIILGAEEETFWGKPDEERCAFFVAVSRAKRRLLLTVCGSREKPPSNPYKWRIVRTPHVEYLEYAAPFIISK